MLCSGKILYLSVNCSYSHSSLAFGQLYTYTKERTPDWNWTKQEYTTKDNINKIICNIISEKPDLLLSTVYLFNRPFVFDLIRKLKVLLPELKIILGGPEFLGDNKKTLLTYPEIEVIFRGDETSFYHYLKSLKVPISQKKINTIPGICYLDPAEHSNYIDNGISNIATENLDSLPSPYNESLIPENKPFMQIETSRGCFSKCSFCTSSLSKNVKFYSIDRVKSDLINIRKADYKEIRVLDRTFNLPVKRACELLNMFINDFSDMKFHLEFEPEKLSDEIINILRAAPDKQFHIETGIQTFYEPSLNFINRKCDILTTKKNLSSLTGLDNIEVHADLIYGLPLQTPESVFKDLNSLIKICPAEIQVEVLKILPGTPLKQKIDHEVTNNRSAVSFQNLKVDNKNVCLNLPESVKLKYSPIPPYEVLSSSEISLEEIINFTYLSKLIDCYYNHNDMQNLIRFAAVNDSHFLNNFLELSKETLSAPEKPSMKKRIKLFSEYAELTNNEILKELILFTSFKMGMFDLANQNLKLIKKQELNNVLSKTGSLIYSEDIKLLEKPVYLADFNCNVGELWKNPFLKVIPKKTSYLFRLSQSGLSKRVSRIELYS